MQDVVKVVKVVGFVSMGLALLTVEPPPEEFQPTTA